MAKAKRELKRISNKFAAYCNKYSFDVSAIKADMKNGKTKVYRYRTPSVYGDMYCVYGNKHSSIVRRKRASRRRINTI